MCHWLILFASFCYGSIQFGWTTFFRLRFYFFRCCCHFYRNCNEIYPMMLFAKYSVHVTVCVCECIVYVTHSVVGVVAVSFFIWLMRVFFYTILKAIEYTSALHQKPIESGFIWNHVHTHSHFRRISMNEKERERG